MTKQGLATTLIPIFTFNKKIMKTKYFALALAPALVLTIATSADARFPSGEGRGNGERRGGMHQQLENVQRSTEKLSNGVQISISSDDADSVAQIQERHADGPKHQREGVTHAVSNTSDGVLLTITSDDAEQVTKMHERSDNLGQGRGGKGRKGGEHGGGLNADRAVEKLANGVQLTITSDDADAVTKIQEHAAKKAEKNREGVSVLVANISNGVIITHTSDDAEMVAKMHERADNLGQGRGGKGGKGGERPDFSENTEKTVTNLSNGVQVTITSDDADVVAKLQAKEQRESKSDEISIVKTNLSNGIQITVTTDNLTLIERIQNRAEKGGKGGERGQERKNFQGQGEHDQEGREGGRQRHGGRGGNQQ